MQNPTTTLVMSLSSMIIEPDKALKLAVSKTEKSLLNLGKIK